MMSTLKFAPSWALCPAGVLCVTNRSTMQNPNMGENVLKADIVCSGHLHIVLGREDGSSIAGHVVGDYDIDDDDDDDTDDDGDDGDGVQTQ